jgi:hypothetical protein
MEAKITTYSSRGDDVLYLYDPETADMKEVNRVLRELANTMPAHPFAVKPTLADLNVDPLTRETTHIEMVRPKQGG